MYCKRLLKAIVFPCLLFFSITAFAQEKVITGRVTDSKDGSAMPGVSITAKGSSAGTQTTADGTYKISVSPSTTVLVFSFVGYEAQEVTIGGKSSVSIQLVNTNATLGEVVVTGYGTAKKKRSYRVNYTDHYQRLSERSPNHSSSIDTGKSTGSTNFNW